MRSAQKPREMGVIARSGLLAKSHEKSSHQY
jgi:hypothetical protein